MMHMEAQGDTKQVQSKHTCAGRRNCAKALWSCETMVIILHELFSVRLLQNIALGRPCTFAFRGHSVS